MKLSEKISKALDSFVEEWDIDLDEDFFPFSSNMVDFIQGLWHQGLISFSCDYIYSEPGFWLQVIIPMPNYTDGRAFITILEGSVNENEESPFFKADSRGDFIQTLLVCEKKARGLLAQLSTEFTRRPS